MCKISFHKVLVQSIRKPSRDLKKYHTQQHMPEVEQEAGRADTPQLQWILDTGLLPTAGASAIRPHKLS